MTMRQLLLNLSEGRPVTINLPALEAGPISHAIGEIRHVLRNPEQVRVDEIIDIRISPRVKEPLYLLSNGERVVVTERHRVARHAEAHGVLQSNGDGTYRWLSHQRIEAFGESVETRGWSNVAAEIAATWDGKLSFKAEQPSQTGVVEPGNEGLRPPQLGALHAIGAHWSLHTKPATIVMPTGTGKTETMLATLAAYVRGPLLVVVPWDLLRSQTARKFLTFGLLRRLGVLDENARNPIVGIITKRPESVSNLDFFEFCNVIVATASSLTGR